MFSQELKDFLFEYSHTAAWWAHAEGLPNVRNTVTLDPDLRDGRHTRCTCQLSMGRKRRKTCRGRP